jgi:hypothetical protein
MNMVLRFFQIEMMINGINVSDIIGGMATVKSTLV